MAKTAEHEKAALSEIGSVERLTRKDLLQILENHALWLDSRGEIGTRADFSGKDLADADLVDARLQDALLSKTVLKGADLTLADLRGAALVQANLTEANLLGTQLQQANLQAADLQDATGLLGPQLAGANLFGAALPESISPLEGLTLVRETAQKAGWLMCLTLLLDALVWLRIFTTPDAQLVKNASALPYSALQTVLPFIPFYLFGPVVILCVYLCFHLYMQHLWDGIAQLPAIFRDGRRLDACLPWFARWSARMHFKWLRKSQSPLGFLEAAIAMLLLYWVAPATILLFWGRYMTLEDLRGTALHILLVAGAVSAAMNFPRMAGKAFGPDSPRPSAEQTPTSRRTILALRAVPPGIGFLLFLLSIGTFLGVPHDYHPAAQSPALIIRAWAPDILWTFGYNPFAQLTEADVSTKPPGWTGREEEIAFVKGANLNRLRLRYIQAYGAFLVKAHLWRTDLRNAYLSEADLREANLRQVDLQFAVLDRAKLARATLPEADLRNANLDRADLRDANLSFAVLSEATLLDATIDGANLYKSDLHSALLQRASLKKTDLREANLENSNLTMANLGESYLISTNLNNARLKNADLSKAILTDASLRKSDLSGAHLQGAVLQGADLAGANLQGADLRGAEGLSAAQVCSAANVR
ncbi:MAG TPA: pentapeptide repeat-containing protein, partial [Candidatus Acidoferrales bacterium]|nr:pentapeptide repeat-containing protein [Candidatus Acidoferrales bacterium]